MLQYCNSNYCTRIHYRYCAYWPQTYKDWESISTIYQSCSKAFRKGEAALPTADKDIGSNDATGHCTRLCAAGYAGYPLPMPIQGALCACDS